MRLAVLEKGEADLLGPRTDAGTLKSTLNNLLVCLVQEFSMSTRTLFRTMPVSIAYCLYLFNFVIYIYMIVFLA